MKLKNKLIPLAALATAASAIVPLTVSCSSDAIKTSDINSVDLSMPSFLPHDAVLSTPDTKGISETKWATDTYTSLIKVHPEYFVDDLRWGVYQNFLSAYTNSNFIASEEGSKSTLLKYTTNIKSLKFGATNPTFSTTNIILPGQGQDQKNTYNTISFKMKIEFEIEVDTYDAVNRSRMGAISSHKVIKASTVVEYKNMIFFAIPAARDNKLEIAYEAIDNAFVDIAPAYSSTLDVNKPGWYITISDLQSQQDLYTYDFDDWGISYDCDMEIEDTRTIGALGPTKTVDKYHLTDFVNNPTKLNNLVNKKSYWRNSNYKITTQYTKNWYNNFWAWFSQNPEQIVANTVLMDIVSYYYINTLNTPTFAKTASSVWNSGSYEWLPRGELPTSLTPVPARFGDFYYGDVLEYFYPGGGLSVVNSQAFMGDDPTLSLDYGFDAQGYARKDPFTLLIPAGGHTGPLYIPSSSTGDEELFGNPIYDSYKDQIDSWLASGYVLPVPTSYTPGRSLIVNSTPNTVDGLTGKWYSIPMASKIAKISDDPAGTIDTIAINSSVVNDSGNSLLLNSRLYNCGIEDRTKIERAIFAIINDLNPDAIYDRDTGTLAYEVVFNYLSYADTFRGEGPSSDYRSLFFTLPKGTKVKIDYLFNDPSGIPEEKVAFQDMPTDILEIRYDTWK